MKRLLVIVTIVALCNQGIHAMGRAEMKRTTKKSGNDEITCSGIAKACCFASLFLLSPGMAAGAPEASNTPVCQWNPEYQSIDLGTIGILSSAEIKIWDNRLNAHVDIPFCDDYQGKGSISYVFERAYARDCKAVWGQQDADDERMRAYIHSYKEGIEDDEESYAAYLGAREASVNDYKRVECMLHKISSMLIAKGSKEKQD